MLFISKQDFQALCLAHPQVSLKVLRVVGARLRRLVGIIEELSFTTVRHRLASFLVRQAERKGKPTKGVVELELPSSNQEFAAHWNRARIGVAQSQPPAGEGIIEIEGRKVVIRDLKALENEIKSLE